MLRKSIPILLIVGVLLGIAGLVTTVHQIAAAQTGAGTETAVPVPADASDIASFAITTTFTCTGTNLLLNPGFEGEYTAYQYPPPGHPDCQTWDPNEPNQHCERANMPQGWHPRWRDDPRPEPWINIMPEYTASTPDQVNPDRVRSGGRSLHYFAFFSTHETAVHQQITAVVGADYCFSVWGHAWSDRLSEDFYSAPPERPDDDGQLYQRVGIDPTGGTDREAGTVIWSDARKQYDFFGEFVVTATAQSPTLTVFIHSINTNPVKHNDVYWDDAFAAVITPPPPSLSVFPGQVGVMAAISAPVTVTVPLQIDLTEGFTWTASLTPAGTITPSLSTLTGPAGTHLTLTLTTRNLLTGTYTSTLMVAAAPEVVGSPARMPITVSVVSEIYSAFLPVTVKP